MMPFSWEICRFQAEMSRNTIVKGLVYFIRENEQTSGIEIKKKKKPSSLLSESHFLTGFSQ